MTVKSHKSTYPKLGKKYWPYAKLKYLAIFGEYLCLVHHIIYVFLCLTDVTWYDSR